MCCSRKYPYPSHGRFFSLNPPSPLPPLWKFHFRVILSFKKIGLLKHPSPLEFPLTFLGAGMDIFKNYTIDSGLEDFYEVEHKYAVCSLLFVTRLLLVLHILLDLLLDLWLVLDLPRGRHLRVGTRLSLTSLVCNYFDCSRHLVCVCMS